MLQYLVLAVIFIIGCSGAFFYWMSTREHPAPPVKKAHVTPPRYKLSYEDSRKIANREAIEVVKISEPVSISRNIPEKKPQQIKQVTETILPAIPDSSNQDLKSLLLDKDKGIYHNIDLITKQGWVDLEFTALELSRLPSGAVGLLEALNSVDTSAKDIAVLCGRSVGLTARVLKLVNSPFYGLRSKIDNIQHAVTYLGYDEIRQIILTTSVFNIAESKGSPLRVDELWKHSLATARITTWLNDRVKVEGRKSLAGTGAMLHDIGQLVLKNWRPEGFRNAVIKSKERGTTLMEEEVTELGLTHALAGIMLMQIWRLPLTLQWLVKGCHLPEINPDMPETALVYLSGQIARCLDMGLDAEDTAEIPDEIRDLLGFKAETLEELIGEGFEEYVADVLDGLRTTVRT
ncbi:MAG: HDOD domain-containing protein [bacterium]|nr:HDOD domain-containing protein [bacterium]